MRILGIDPGIERTGFAVLEFERGAPIRVLDFGRITTDKHRPLSERLSMLHNDVDSLVQTWQPSHAALEEVFFSKNVKTAITVAHARGVILHCLSQARITIKTFTPNVIKQTFTGDGRADKVQLQKMMHHLFGITTRHDDAADAIACAFCLTNYLAHETATL